MTEQEIMNAITEAVREEIENPAIQLRPETTASQIPGWDSLAHVRIIFNIEARVGADIEMNETYKAANIGELVALVRSKVPR